MPIPLGHPPPLYVRSVVNMGIFSFKRLGSQVKKVGTQNSIALENFTPTVTKMVTLWTLVTRNMSTNWV